MHWSELYAKLREHVVPRTELRRQLHWLPVKQRINYKLAVLTSRRGRAEVRHIWHLSLVTVCHLVH